MAYFRCMSSTVSGSDKYTISIITEDSNLYGNPVTISKDDEVIATVNLDDSGEATYVVYEEGIYIISTTFEGVTYTSQVDVIPYQTDITTYPFWYLWCQKGGVDPSKYSGLDDLLKDEFAVRKLFTRHAAVDYLAAHYWM